MKNFILSSFIFLFTLHMLSAQWQEVYHFNHQISYGMVLAKGGDTVLVAGNSEVVHFSDDGGQSFSGDSLPFLFGWFHDIDFPSHNTGYICGGSAFGPVKSFIGKTTDGGKTWDSISGNQFGYDLSAVSFLNDDRGFFTGSNLLVKTTDGGQSFSVDTLKPFAAATDMSFLSASTGFYMYHRHIYKTLDSGQTWNIVFTDTNQNIFPIGGHKLHFIDQQNGFALLQAGEIIKTTDAGSSWQYSVVPPDTFGVVDFDFVSVNTGYATTYAPGSGGARSRIYKTINGGQTWMLQYIDSTQILRSISAASADVAYAIGDTTLVATYNGGIGVDEYPGHRELSVFPNPASQYFEVSFPSGKKVLKLDLLDATGSLLKEYPLPAWNQKYSLAGIPPGIYILQVETSQAYLQQKLMVH